LCAINTLSTSTEFCIRIDVCVTVEFCLVVCICIRGRVVYVIGVIGICIGDTVGWRRRTSVT
jgi:hypothetical protein